MTQPNFYTVLPAPVRYARGLSSNAKLLYGEIVAFADREGHCRTPNAYFGQLFDVDPRSVTRWVGELQQSGLLSVTLDAGRLRLIKVHFGASPKESLWKPHNIEGQDNSVGSDKNVDSCAPPPTPPPPRGGEVESMTPDPDPEKLFSENTLTTPPGLSGGVVGGGHVGGPPELFPGVSASRPPPAARRFRPGNRPLDAIEVRDAVSELGLRHVAADVFWHHYEGRKNRHGRWVCGARRQPMGDWTQILREWDARGATKSPDKAPPGAGGTRAPPEGWEAAVGEIYGPGSPHLPKVWAEVPPDVREEVLAGLNGGGTDGG